MAQGGMDKMALVEGELMSPMEMGLLRACWGCLG